MGRRIPDGQEPQVLRELISEARTAARELRDAIRDANHLAATLTSDYQAYHDQEIRELSNAITQEYNQVARDLNQAIERARIMINNQIMSGVAVFDVTTETVSIHWGAGMFDDHQKNPYPRTSRKGNTQ